MYDECQDEMINALASDLRKHKQEAIIFEIEFLKNDLIHSLQNLHEWTKPETVCICISFFKSLLVELIIMLIILQPEKSLVNLLDGVLIYKDPFGVVLVMGAWNYPLQLTLLPVQSAIAAGNTVIIKPSEVAPATAKFIAETIPKYLDNVRTNTFNC